MKRLLSVYQDRNDLKKLSLQIESAKHTTTKTTQSYICSSTFLYDIISFERFSFCNLYKQIFVYYRIPSHSIMLLIADSLLELLLQILCCFVNLVFIFTFPLQKQPFYCLLIQISCEFYMLIFTQQLAFDKTKKFLKFASQLVFDSMNSMICLAFQFFDLLLSFSPSTNFKHTLSVLLQFFYFPRIFFLKIFMLLLKNLFYFFYFLCDFLSLYFLHYFYLCPHLILLLSDSFCEMVDLYAIDPELVFLFFWDDFIELSWLSDLASTHLFF